MSGTLTGRSERAHETGASAILSVLSLSLLAFFLGTASAAAQSVGPDEAFNGAGAVPAELALTQAQQSAIYHAVLQQHARGPAVAPGAVTPAVGAPVSAAVELAALPGSAADADPTTADLKYAMVEDDVVVVDPIRMRVVDVIHGSTRP